MTFATLCVGVLAGLPASAHDADVVYARLEPGPNGALLEIVTLTNATLALLAPVDADGDGVLTQGDLDARAESVRAGVWNDLPLAAGGVPCARDGEAATLEDGFVTLTARFACGAGDLRQDFRILRILPANYRVVLGSQLDGERGRRFAQGVFTALEVPRPGPPALLDPGRLGRAFERGVRDAGVLEALALLLLLWLTGATWRALVLRVGLVLLGALAVFAGHSSSLVAATLMLAGVVGALWPSTGRLARAPAAVGAALAGVGLALRGTAVGLSEGLGWWLGFGGVALALAVIGLPVGRLLGRRPRAAFGVRLGLAALALVPIGVRLAAA
jgi:hypothetical protein